MAHVDVDHPVVAVGPDHWKVAAIDDVFQTHREIAGRERHQHFDVGILARFRRPLVELGGGADIGVGKIAGDRMVLAVQFQQGRLRWPVVALEHAAAQEFEEPGPLGPVVVVGGRVEPDPAAAVLHIVFEQRTGLARRSGVERDDGSVFFQLIGRESAQILGRIDDEPFADREFVEKGDGLVIELDVGLFGRIVIEQQYFETGTVFRVVGLPIGSIGRAGGGTSASGQRQGQEEKERLFHKPGFS